MKLGDISDNDTKQASPEIVKQLKKPQDKTRTAPAPPPSFLSDVCKILHCRGVTKPLITSHHGPMQIHFQAMLFIKVVCQLLCGSTEFGHMGILSKKGSSRMDMQAYLVIGFQSWRLLEANIKHWIDQFLEWGHINYSSHPNTAECKKK